MAAVRKLDSPRAGDSTPDLIDVPAAIVCVQCSEPDCAGQCVDEATQSGIVQIVPWERPGGSVLPRLWVTARGATENAASFFGGLPDGSVLSAFRFAVMAELLALLGHLCVALPVLALLAPRWARYVLTEPDTRLFALRVLLLGVPLFALVLVAGHAAHGLAFDLGARRQGARGQAQRALRLGLYATGWDLVVGPLGFVVLGTQHGLRHATSTMGLLRGVPARSLRAFAASHYRLSAEGLQKALRSSLWGAALGTGLAVLTLIAALVGMALL